MGSRRQTPEHSPASPARLCSAASEWNHIGRHRNMQNQCIRHTAKVRGSAEGPKGASLCSHISSFPRARVSSLPSTELCSHWESLEARGCRDGLVLAAGSPALGNTRAESENASPQRFPFRGTPRRQKPRLAAGDRGRLLFVPRPQRWDLQQLEHEAGHQLSLYKSNHNYSPL